MLLDVVIDDIFFDFWSILTNKSSLYCIASGPLSIVTNSAFQLLAIWE